MYIGNYVGTFVHSYVATSVCAYKGTYIITHLFIQGSFWHYKAFNGKE
ncbi:MAG: hypothetical protein Q4C98_08710 [Capnocytophaga sp.]|nr:hypothetical protein [Capnocytophaga sp.]